MNASLTRVTIIISGVQMISGSSTAITSTVSRTISSNSSSVTLTRSSSASVAGRYDINRTLVFWHYPSVNANPRGTLDSYVSLNLRTGKWGFGRLHD